MTRLQESRHSDHPGLVWIPPPPCPCIASLEIGAPAPRPLSHAATPAPLHPCRPISSPSRSSGDQRSAVTTAGHHRLNESRKGRPDLYSRPPVTLHLTPLVRPSSNSSPGCEHRNAHARCCPLGSSGVSMAERGARRFENIPPRLQEIGFSIFFRWA